jgi:hypothetical protein
MLRVNFLCGISCALTVVVKKLDKYFFAQPLTEIRHAPSLLLGRLPA